MQRYKIADIVFDVQLMYGYTAKLCENYIYDGDEQPCFTAVMTQQDIEAEKKGGEQFPDYYLESLALYRKLCDYALINANAIVFHSSAIMVDNEAYLFTAQSGTGKSTHARLWREMLGDKAIMVNDDKPIIRYVDGDFYVYGTPWNGKHHLDTNTRAKIKAICKIYQDKQNSIKRLTNKEMLHTILNQTLIPTEVEKVDKLFELIDKMLRSVDLYTLGCTISREAAELSYSVMSKGEKNSEN
ncbi:MAG: hypothetical protein E7348_00800 [Clostridiales bacterium]|nr:hypothetical protein [Clostridiales bacterium]